ncbi:MAG: nicotinamide-nucleotide adenylyltransferase [Halobacteria archaeon]
MVTRALYLGRFQPYHLGHHAVIQRIASDAALDELIIGIGSAQKSHEVSDPFTAGERVVMVTRALKELKKPYYVIPIPDVRKNSIYVSHVRSLVPPFKCIYSNNPLVVRLFQEWGIEVRNPPLFERDKYEGKEIRRRMLNDEPWEHLVPEEVVKVIEEVGGVKRLKSVAGSD